jgi:hypothetical protein
MTDIINLPIIDDLSILIEEGARATATEKSISRFIEPAAGTLRRAASRQHHIVFGRRGSGKTSLLRKAAADLTIDRRPIAYVDLEPYKGHRYPDVLISILIATFTSFKDWLETAAVNPATKKSFWKKLFGTSPKRSAFSRKRSAVLVERIGRIIDDLNDQLHSIDNAQLQRTYQLETEQTREGELGSALQAPNIAKVTSSVAESSKATSSTEIQETFNRSKIDFLYRHIMEYRDIFKDMSSLSEGNAFLFLDDLYHIPRSDQSQLLDYFHRIAKGSNLWLKIGTIRHRSEWYIHGDPPVGLKLGDDAHEINLDLTLEKYALTKEFLIDILNGLIAECEAPPVRDFVADGAIDRLVLASGGVARDFLGIFRRSVDATRERRKRKPHHYRGPKIGAEDVNLATGDYGETKQEEFKRDTLEDRIKLEEQFAEVRSFCINQTNANCFLLDQDAKGEAVELINELVDLRLVHLVKSRETVSSGRTGKVYKAYMLDVSQYAGERKRRTLEMVEFWRTGARGRLRRASLIYTPDSQEDDI